MELKSGENQRGDQKGEDEMGKTKARKEVNVELFNSEGCNGKKSFTNCNCVKSV